MDRKQIFPGQIPLETDLLGTNKNVMIALGKLSAAVFGTASYVNGLTTGPNSPAALSVVVQPGELYSLQNIDGTAYSSIAADTTHQIVKQGVLLDTTTLSTPAPATGGFSINYLIQAAFSEIDTDAVVLPYYNASNPTQAYSGPANAGTTNNTTRKDTIILSAKAGIAATTGTQTTPAADAGYIGLYVVTVANGQTTVTAPNIVQLATAPIIPAGIIPAIQSGVYGYAVDTGAANVYQATYSPAITALTDGMVLKFKAAHANTGASTFSPNGLAAQPIWGGDHAALTGGEIAPNGEVWAQWNTSLNGTGAWVLIDSTNGYIKSPTPPAGDNSAKLAPTAFIAARIGDTGSASWRNALDNSTAQITTRPAATLSTTPQFGTVDRMAAWASAGAVSAGTIGQVTNSAAGRTGDALGVTGVTLTGSAVMSTRYRMRAADAVHFKNILASFQMKVWHDVGSSVPYTIIIRKPTVADNFTSTTVINTGSPISVASGTATTITSLGVSMGDCSNGLEFEVQAACGAVTTKNFHFVEWGLEEGSVATNLPYRPIEIERVNCYWYARILTGMPSGIKFLAGIVSSTTTAEMTFPFTFAKTPNITQSGIQLWDGTGSPAITSIGGFSGLSGCGASTFTASGGGLTVGRSCAFRANTGPSDFILFDAEL